MPLFVPDRGSPPAAPVLALHCARAFVAVSLAVVLGGAWSAAALEPDKALPQFPHRVWQTAEGLPQNSVLALAQTGDGYLWSGTWEGLVRFDGVRFTVFDKTNTAALPGRSIRSLVSGQDGTLWIATPEGIAGMRQGVFFPVTTPAGEVLRSEGPLLVARDGSLWVATTDKGLVWLSGDRFRTWRVADGLASDVVSALAEDETGAVWVGTSAGLHRWDGTALEAVVLREDSRAWVTALARDPKGGVWAGTRDGQVYRIHGGGVRQVAEAGMPGIMITVLLVDRHGSLWVGSSGGGLLRLARGQRSLLDFTQGMVSNNVTDLLEDVEGNLWVGTEGGGLHRFKDAPFTPYGLPEGLTREMVGAILEARDGSLWFATFGGGVNRWHEGRMTSWTTRQGLAHDHVQSISEGRDGGLWFATRGGISRWHEGTITPLGSVQGLPEGRLRMVLEDLRGTLWAGTSAGLARWDGSRFRALDGLGLPGKDITALRESAAGGLWVGTRGGGLAHLRDGHVVLLASEDGPLSDNVQALHEDDAGALWIGTNEGFYRWRAGRFTRFSVADGLFDDRIFQILLDARGDFWLTCNKGVFRVAKAELEALAEGRMARVTSRAYGREDGMRSEECNGGGTPAGWKGRDGRLWFPTIRGAVAYDPAKDEVRTPLPPVLLEEIRVDGQSVPAHAWTRVPPGEGDVEFHYTVASLGAPQQVRFRYRLEGIDADWVEAGTRRVAYYTRLPPGHYRFHVSARRADGGWEEPGAAVELHLRPHFHQTGLFRLACALAAVLALVGGVWLRLRRHRAREHELRAHVQQRTAELAAVNASLNAHLQELQAAKEKLVQAEKMAAVGTLAAGVGHEINNPLAFIIANLRFAVEEVHATAARGEDLERWQEVEEALSDALQGADRVRRIVKDLKTFSRAEPERPGRVDLHEVLELSLAMADGQIRHRARVVKDYGTPPAVLGEQTRIGQVFLNLLINAAQAIPEGQASHNEIRITTRADARGWAVVGIHDTGTGILPEVLPRIFEPFFTTKPVGEGTGLGLSICHGFIQALGGDIQVRSEVGRGTIFEVFLPAFPEETEAVREERTWTASSRTGRGRLLLIDDEPMVMAALTRTLASEHDVEALTSARQALERLRTGERYDLILCDLMMPEMTGMELHAVLSREEPSLAERMVFLTGGAFTQAASTFLESTRQPWFEKPFEPDALRARIHGLLARSSPARELVHRT